MRKYLIISMALASSLAAGAATANDGIASDTTAVELKGVEVEARLQSTSAKESVYIPTSREKNAANNGYFLLQTMGIPELSIQAMNGSVTTASGDEVALFVNFLPASKEEIEGMRTADVRRVDVLRFPSDPRFGGARNVVNFIVQPYEYGGYTKLMQTDYIMSCVSNTSALYSKFAYKKMTVDLSAYVNNYRTHHSGTTDREVYRILDNGGEVARDGIFRRSDFANDGIPVSLRAVYSSKDVMVSNSAGFTFVKSPKRTRDGSLHLSLDGMDDYDYAQGGSRYRRAAWWSGMYYFGLPKGFSLSVSPKFTYSNNDDVNTYSTTRPGSAKLVSDASESMYYTRADASVRKAINSHHTVGIDMLGLYQKNKVAYSGTDPFRNDFTNTAYAFAPTYYLQVPRFWASVDGGVCAERTTINGQGHTDVYPYVHVNSSYSPNDKNSITAYLQYATNGTDIASRSPNVIRQNELMYYTGNTDIDNSRHFTARINYNWMPSNSFSLTGYAYYFGNYDRLVPVYEKYEHAPGVIRTFENSGTYTRGSLGLSAMWRLLNRRLSLQLMPSQHFYRSTGFYDLRHNPLNLSASASYFIGSFYFYASYGIGSRSLSEEGVWTKGRSDLSLSASWSNSNWNISVYAQNLLHGDYQQSTSYLYTPVYDKVSTNYAPDGHRSIVVRVTFTVGYGKKVNRGNEVSDGSEGTSGIMR